MLRAGPVTTAFMEATGTFRDMISTHLFQLPGFLALERPNRVDADTLHEEKRKLFGAIRPLDRRTVTFGFHEPPLEIFGQPTDGTPTSWSSSSPTRPRSSSTCGRSGRAPRSRSGTRS